MTAGVTSSPLSRNRNYQLLWGSQALSQFGSNASVIAYPLLVLSMTDSAAASGLVWGTVALVQLVAGLPGGALADRWERKKIMLGSEAAQGIAVASLALAIWWGTPTMAHIVVVAAVAGLSTALFGPAEAATLPNLVRPEQLPTALAMNSARSYLGLLTGNAAGGFLFAVARAMPFATNAATRVVAFVGLCFLRMPPSVPRPRRTTRLGGEVAAGLRWVWHQRHIRATMLCAVVLNLFFTAFYLLMIVLARDRGVPAGQIGVMAAMLSVGGIVGSLVAPRLHRLVQPHVSIVAVFWWMALLTPLGAIAHSGYSVGVLLFALALLPPTANTAIMSEQLACTPDALRGRLSGALGVLAGASGTIGPVLGGLLAETATGDLAVAVCAAGIVAAAILATLSRTLRTFRRTLDREELDVEETP